MKKTLLLTLSVALHASSPDINMKIENLEKELQSLKQELRYHQEDLDERMPIIEKIEKKSILDKVNFSPEIMLRVDKFNYKSNTIKGENTTIVNPSHPMFGEQRRDEFTKDFDLATSMRFRLNMHADLEEIQFHGRLLYNNSSQSNERVCILSRDIKTGPAGSAFDVDRAYIDYSPNRFSESPFTFTFGILPTTGGTPMHFAQNKKRNSMFPALVFDMNTYGAIATQKIGSNSYARVILAKPYTLKADFYPYQCNRENIDDADITGLYVDTKFKFLGDALLSFGVNALHNLKAHPYLGPDVSSSDAHDLGTMYTFGAGIDIENIANEKLKLFLHTAISNPHGNGNKDDYKITHYDARYTGLTKDNKIGFTEADYASGEMVEKNGFSIYLGGKYDLNREWHFGAEYNFGNKYWFSATQGAEDMFNKLATRGSAYEFYTVWKYHKHLNAKLSYLNIYEDYTGSGWHFGTPAAKDATQSIFSLSLEARF